MGDQIPSALFLGLELYQALQEPNPETPAPSLPLEPWWPAAAPSRARSQQQWQPREPLDSAPVSLVIAPCVAKCTQTTLTFPECFWCHSRPLLSLALLSTQGESKEHFPGCGCITEVLEDPKILLVTLKPTLAKDGDRVAPCSPCPLTTVVGVLLARGRSSRARWLSPG